MMEPDETPQYGIVHSAYVFVGRVGRFDVWHDPDATGELPWLITWDRRGDAGCWFDPRLTPVIGSRAEHITPHEWCLLHQTIARYADRVPNQKEPNQ